MRSTTRSVVSVLVLLSLTALLLAGCGGGEEPGDAPQGGSGQDVQSEGGPKESKIGVGNVVSVNEDKRRMAVRPSRQIEGTERLVIKVRKNAEMTLGGQGAEMGDVAEGQQAQVEYVVVNGVNRATSVQLFGAEGQPSGGEGTSN